MSTCWHQEHRHKKWALSSFSLRHHLLQMFTRSLYRLIMQLYFQAPACSTSDWDELPKKRKMKIQTTKKKGCTAYMHIKTIKAYPDFKVKASYHESKVLPFVVSCFSKNSQTLTADERNLLQKIMHLRNSCPVCMLSLVLALYRVSRINIEMFF